MPISNEEITDLLAGVANEIESRRRRNPEDHNMLLLGLEIAARIQDFFEDKSENLCRMFDRKLDFLDM